MTSTLGTKYLSDLYRGAEAHGREEGLAEGQAELVLIVLEGRGVAVSADEREQILACRDLEKTREWGRRAATARTTADVLG